MYIFDSSLKQKVEFKPIEEKKARIYVCGPTVYDDSHLGHARSALSFDLLRRVLTFSGYKVTFVKNFTDIDDKIIMKLKQTGQSLEELTNFYIASYKNEMNAIGVKDADIEPKATESLGQIIDFIEVLLQNKSAYKTSDGVYFDTSKDSKYLSLSNQNLDSTKSRIEENSEKKDSKDFALWKLFDKNEIGFDSPFGYGRPGWHIECSAMIKHHLACDGEYQIDIHAGGADLLFPHHENEAAQTRMASHQCLAKYWMHNGFVNINGEKMSKSLGNSFFLKDILKIYAGEIVRFYLLSTHYRSDFDFNEIDLLKSKKRLDKIYRLKKRLQGVSSSKIHDNFKENLLSSLQDDLNISKALSHLDEMINEANEKLDKNPKDRSIKAEFAANLDFIKELLGFGTIDEVKYFQLGVSEEQKAEINTLLQKRSEAKKAKDFVTADKIRDELLAKGILIQDTPNGVVWEKQ